MPSSLEYVRQLASEFDNVIDDDVSAMITTATLFANVSALDVETTACALALYAAHLLWLKRNQGSGGGARGVILSEKDDKVERKYSIVQGSDDWYGQSLYGGMYLKLTVGVLPSAILTRF